MWRKKCIIFIGEMLYALCSKYVWSSIPHSNLLFYIVLYNFELIIYMHDGLIIGKA